MPSHYKAPTQVVNDKKVEALDSLLEEVKKCGYGLLVTPNMPMQEFRELVSKHKDALNFVVTFQNEGKVLLRFVK